MLHRCEEDMLNRTIAGMQRSNAIGTAQIAGLTSHLSCAMYNAGEKKYHAHSRHACRAWMQTQARVASFRSAQN